MFADLVKYFDTSNHKLLISILGRYGAPPRFCFAIIIMYENSVVRLIIGKFCTSIPFKVGVKQGYSMSPFSSCFSSWNFPRHYKNNGQGMGSQNPHSQDRATHLFLPAILSATSQKISNQAIS